MTTPCLLDQVRDAIRVRHDSRRTEDTYVHWIRHFILFHAKHHPREMGEHEVTAFLTYLAVQKNVAASTQNQALSALLFLNQKVLEMPVEWLNDAFRARWPVQSMVCRMCMVVSPVDSRQPRRIRTSWPG